MSLSIIIPAFSGEKTIKGTLQSILNQTKKDFVTEVVLVIDGPNQKINQIGKEYMEQFASISVKYMILHLPENVGVFRAILKGAEMARSEKILLVSDRMELPAEYSSKLSSLKQKIIIPYIDEGKAKNPVSQTLFLIRQKIYKGQNTSYNIDLNNFENATKGTGGLYIDRQLFISASKSVEGKRKSSKDISDDTKLFCYLVDKGNKIYRSASLKAYYIPRETMAEEAMHVFRRGPKFVDYYLKPNTRYFLPLIVCLVLFHTLLITIIIQPSILLAVIGLALITVLAFSYYLSQNLIDFGNVLIGLPVLSIFFWGGILRGSYIKLSIRFLPYTFNLSAFLHSKKRNN